METEWGLGGEVEDFLQKLRLWAAELLPRRLWRQKKEGIPVAQTIAEQMVRSAVNNAIENRRDLQKKAVLEIFVENFVLHQIVEYSKQDAGILRDELNKVKNHDIIPSIVRYTEVSPAPEGAVQLLSPVPDASKLIDMLAAMVPEGQRAAYKAEARAHFEAAAGVVARDDSRPVHDVAPPVGITEGAHEVTEPRSAPEAPAISDADAVKAVFGDVPDSFRTGAYTRNPHPELVHHPAILAQAKEIVHANRRTKVTDLAEPDREKLRQARRILQTHRRKTMTATNG